MFLPFLDEAKSSEKDFQCVQVSVHKWYLLIFHLLDTKEISLIREWKVSTMRSEKQLEAVGQRYKIHVQEFAQQVWAFQDY